MSWNACNQDPRVLETQSDVSHGQELVSPDKARGSPTENIQWREIPNAGSHTTQRRAQKIENTEIRNHKSLVGGLSLINAVLKKMRSITSLHFLGIFGETTHSRTRQFHDSLELTGIIYRDFTVIEFAHFFDRSPLLRAVVATLLQTHSAVLVLAQDGQMLVGRPALHPRRALGAGVEVLRRTVIVEKVGLYSRIKHEVGQVARGRRREPRKHN